DAAAQRRVRQREELKDGESRRAELRRRNLVAGETIRVGRGRAGRRAGPGAGPVRQRVGQAPAEVAYSFGRGRDEELQRRDEAANLAPPLLVPEEEGPVLALPNPLVAAELGQVDRAAEVEAEVVVAQLGLGLPAAVVEEVAGVQHVVAQELEERAVELIG